MSLIAIKAASATMPAKAIKPVFSNTPMPGSVRDLQQKSMDQQVQETEAQQEQEIEKQKQQEAQAKQQQALADAQAKAQKLEAENNVLKQHQTLHKKELDIARAEADLANHTNERRSESHVSDRFGVRFLTEHVKHLSQRIEKLKKAAAQNEVQGQGVIHTQDYNGPGRFMANQYGSGYSHPAVAPAAPAAAPSTPPSAPAPVAAAPPSTPLPAPAPAVAAVAPQPAATPTGAPAEIPEVRSPVPTPVVPDQSQPAPVDTPAPAAHISPTDPRARLAFKQRMNYVRSKIEAEQDLANHPIRTAIEDTIGVGGPQADIHHFQDMIGHPTGYGVLDALPSAAGWVADQAANYGRGLLRTGYNMTNSMADIAERPGDLRGYGNLAGNLGNAALDVAGLGVGGALAKGAPLLSRIRNLAPPVLSQFIPRFNTPDMTSKQWGVGRNYVSPEDELRQRTDEMRAQNEANSLHGNWNGIDVQALQNTGYFHPE